MLEAKEILDSVDMIPDQDLAVANLNMSNLVHKRYSDKTRIAENINALIACKACVERMLNNLQSKQLAS